MAHHPFDKYSVLILYLPFASLYFFNHVIQLESLRLLCWMTCTCLIDMIRIMHNNQHDNGAYDNEKEQKAITATKRIIIAQLK